MSGLLGIHAQVGYSCHNRTWSQHPFWERSFSPESRPTNISAYVVVPKDGRNAACWGDNQSCLNVSFLSIIYSGRGSAKFATIVFAFSYWVRIFSSKSPPTCLAKLLRIAMRCIYSIFFEAPPCGMIRKEKKIATQYHSFRASLLCNRREGCRPRVRHMPSSLICGHFGHSRILNWY